ncbi:MAG: efflux transporter outer membrane subunit [Azospirillaceae bacterium]|nr:efflux transporter outer membrane subunit [Azospirillaceae bacterium]
MKRLSLLLLPILFGCTVGPDYQAPALPAANVWAGPTGKETGPTDTTSWWARFNDPLLDRLIEQAARANADVAQAAAKLRQARASLVQETAGFYPSATASASAKRSRQSLAAYGGAGSITGNYFDPGFDASYELDLFGGQRRSVESAAASLEASSADLGDSLLSMLGETARYYIQVRGYQARIGIAEATLASRKETWQLTRAKAEGGTGTGLDALQAKAEMESAAAGIPPLEDDLQEAIDRLATLTGGSTADLRDLLRVPQPVPQLVGAIEPDPPVVALARRPDIRAAERRIASATADIGVAQADRFPSVTLVGSIGLNSSRIRTLATGSSLVWSWGPEVSLPIFDAGKRAAKVDEKTALRDEKIAAWQATVRSAVEETENALVALDREKAHNIGITRTVEAYGDALKVAQAQYQAGLTTFLTVLEADRSLASERDSLAQSDANLAIDAIALYKALGGGWQQLQTGADGVATDK